MKLLTGDLFINDLTRKIWDKTHAAEVEQLGFDFGVYCYMDSNHSFKSLCTNSAEPWVNHHFNHQYYSFDPLLTQVIKSKNIVYWDKIAPQNNLHRQIFSERYDFGMSQGITIPVKNKQNQVIAWFSLSSRDNLIYQKLISNPALKETINLLHIKLMTEVLAQRTKLDYNDCHALALSTIYNDIEKISVITGLSYGRLYKVFGLLYCNDVACASIHHASFSGEINPNFQSLISLLHDNLTDRQLACIRMISSGLTAKKAAKLLNISPRTYEDHVGVILKKYQCKNQKELLGKLSVT